MRRVMDPAVRLSVPILAFSAEGWWIQIARRLIWVTSETEDEGRLIELLVDNRRTGGEVAPLAAVEPILIAARMTRQPADWAFTARIWTEGVRRPISRPWRKIAKAIHGHGIPTITLDPASTPNEIACQVVLKGTGTGTSGATSQHWRMLSRWRTRGRSSAFSALPVLRTVRLPPRRCSNS